NATDLPATSHEIRKRGCRMFAGGMIVFGAILYLMYWLSAHGHHILLPLIGASLPFVFVCVGFIEAVTGAPYLRLAHAWMSLRGWQRGLLGTFIVLAAFVFII